MPSLQRIRQIALGLALGSYVAVFQIGTALAATQLAMNIVSCPTAPVSGTVVIDADFTSAATTCFKVGAAGVVIEGNGHTVTLSTTGARLVDVTSTATAIYNNVTVQNISSNGDVYVNGDTADGFVLQNSTIGNLSIYSADDTQIVHNTMSSFLLWGKHATVTNNMVSGTAQRVVDIMGDGALGAPSFSGCPAIGNHVFSGNTFTNTNPTLGAEASALAIRCSTDNSFTNNTFTGLNATSAVLLKDGAERNTFSDNQLVGNTAPAGALYFSDSSVYVSDPANNIFQRNSIRAAGGAAINELYTSGGNQFTGNVLQSGGSVTAALRVDPSAGRTAPDVFDHNTFYNSASNGNGVQFGTGTDAATRFPTHFQFTNNIVSYAGALTYSFVGPIDWSGMQLDYNLYNDRSGSILLGRYDFDNDGAPEGIADLAVWRTKTGSEAHSLIGDPQFNNVGASDFRILSTSPASTHGSAGSNIGAKETMPAACVPNWQCTVWNMCQANGTQTRTCTDVNACGMTTGKPAELQSCTPVDTIAPSVAVTVPANNATVYGTLTLNATASDNVGVEGVQFKLNGDNFGAEDLSAPYLATWTATTAGTYTITAVARDAAGNTQASDPITVHVVVPCTPNWQCTVWSLCPVSGIQTRTCTDLNACGVTTGKPAETQSCTYVPGDTTAPYLKTNLKDGKKVSRKLTITASTKDASGINRVEFYINGVLISTDSQASYKASWESRTKLNGPVRVTVKSYDNAGNVTSQSFNLLIQNRLGIVVTGGLGPKIPVSGTVRLTAVQFGGEPITRIEFMPSTRITTVMTQSPFQYDWNTRLVPNGGRWVKVKAFDAFGHVTNVVFHAKVLN